jgi:hypothetical protein
LHRGTSLEIAVNKKQLAAIEAACDAARDLGRDHFRQKPEAMLIEVSRMASASLTDKKCQLAFLEGYQQARAQHEAFLKEKTNE